MERLLNFIRGNVRIRVKCRYPERFINICARSGVEFWDMVREGEELVFTTHYADYRYLRQREQHGNYKIIGVKKTGTSFFIWRMRKRYALLIGMILCLGLTGLSSFFVWEITVSGNEKVSAAEILSNLEDLGVHIGCSRLTINQDYLSNEMLQRVPELCWITVNTHGSRADVKVREEIPAPEVIDEKEATVVFAKKSGIIEKMVVLEGAKNVAVGETVQAGDILVTGEMESLSSGTRYVHAMGDIYARTWYTRSVQLSETVGIKNYTGNEKTRYTLVLGGHRISLSFRDLGWEHYDKEIHEKKLKLLGAVLPVGVAAETYEEYTVEYVPASNLEETLKARLLDDLKEETDGGEIIWTEFETKSEEGVMTVTVNAECLEQIGEVRKLTEKDLHESEETG